MTRTRPAHRAVHDRAKSSKNSGVASGNGIGRERGHRDFRHVVQVAPEQRLGEQEHVAAGEEDVLVGRAGGGNALAGEAPVLAVQVGDRLLQDAKRLERRGADRGEEAVQVVEFGGFPEEAGADVERMDRRVSADGLGEKHRAIEPAADEHGERRGGIAGGQGECPVGVVTLAL